MPVQRAADCRSNCHTQLYLITPPQPPPQLFPSSRGGSAAAAFGAVCEHLFPRCPAQYSASTSRVKRYALLQQGSHRSMGTCRAGGGRGSSRQLFARAQGMAWHTRGTLRTASKWTSCPTGRPHRPWPHLVLLVAQVPVRALLQQVLDSLNCSQPNMGPNMGG